MHLLRQRAEAVDELGGEAFDGAVVLDFRKPPVEREPYRQVREVNEDARGGIVRIAESAKARKVPAFLFVNNRLEGNTPSTIESVVADFG